jgi:membrane protein
MMHTLEKLAQFGRFYLKEVKETKALDSANILTLSTLFAIVPMMSLMYAILQMMPALQKTQLKLQQWLFENLVPNASHQIAQHLSQFAVQAQGLTQIGVVMLIVTSVFMLSKIEKAMNQVWRVGQHRSGFRAMTTYWALLTIGPVLLSFGFLMTSYVISMKVFSSVAVVSALKKWLLTLAPFVFTATFLSLLYIMMPFCRVPVRAGVQGALVAGIAFETAKWGFGHFMAAFPSYRFIYGAFAFFPLFLVWIYLSWTIVLLGAVLSRCLVSYHSQKGVESPWMRLDLFYQLWQAAQTSQSLKEAHFISCYSYSVWENLRSLMEQKKWILISAQSEVVLRAEAYQLTLQELFADYPLKDLRLIMHPPKEGMIWHAQLLSEINPLWQSYESLNKTLLLSIFEHALAHERTV